MRKLIKTDEWLEKQQDCYLLPDIFNYKGTIWNTILDFTYYIPKNKIKDRYYKIKWGLQRCFKGYSDADVFELFSNFVDRYIKVLTDLKNHHNGYPGNGITDEDWENILQHMIDCLVTIRDNDDFTLKSDKIRIKAKNEFMDLFNYWFFDLWD